MEEQQRYGSLNFFLDSGVDTTRTKPAPPRECRGAPGLGSSPADSESTMGCLWSCLGQRNLNMSRQASREMPCGGPTRLKRSNRQLISALRSRGARLQLALARSSTACTPRWVILTAASTGPQLFAHAPGFPALPPPSTPHNADIGRLHAPVGPGRGRCRVSGGDFGAASSVRSWLAPVLPHPRARHARP